MSDDEPTIQLRYKGWHFEFDSLPKSDELERLYQERIAKTELIMPLPVPTQLHRSDEWTDRDLDGRTFIVIRQGDSPILDIAVRALRDAGASVEFDRPNDGTQTHHGILADLSGATDPSSLTRIAAAVAQQVPRLARSGRVVLLARDVTTATSPADAAVQRSAAGFIKTLARELGPAGATANGIAVADGVSDEIIPLLQFLASPRSAFVSGELVAADRVDPLPPGFDRRQQTLEGKSVLITGAARGIGRATAARCAREGARVLAIDLPVENPYGEPGSEQLLEKLASEIDAETLCIDISSGDAPAALSDWLNQYGPIDVIVHNAAIVRDAMVATMSDRQWSDVLDVNLAAATRITEALIERDLIREWGRLILVGSVAGLAGNFGQANYATSKAGLVGLMEFYARHPPRTGVTTNVVAAGTTETRLLRRNVPDWMLEAGRRLNALSQPALPRDVADVIAFLASPHSQPLNGRTLRVCGAALQGA